MSFAVLEPAVRVVVVLCRTAAVDHRIQICRLGESLFVPLLRVWKNKPADRLKVISASGHFVKLEQWERWRAKWKFVSGSKYHPSRCGGRVRGARGFHCGEKI